MTSSRSLATCPDSATGPVSAPARYRLRFAAEALSAAWRNCQATRRGGRARHSWALAGLSVARWAAASALLLPLLLAAAAPAAGAPQQGLTGLLAGSSIPDPRPIFQNSSRNPFGLVNVGKYASPVFADLDGDGDLDALVGERYGNTVYFRNTGTPSRPAFAAPSSNPFGLSDVGEWSRPTFADLDGDGDLDAFIGERYGNTVYFRNTGSTTAPAFAAPTNNPFGLDFVQYQSDPTFADLDADGDLDAFIGDLYGNTVYFRNSGAVTAPAFAAASNNPFGLADVGWNASPAFADLDGDGDLDAFIGQADLSVVYFRNTGVPIHPAFIAAGSNPFDLADVGRNPNPTSPTWITTVTLTCISARPWVTRSTSATAAPRLRPPSPCRASTPSAWQTWAGTPIRPSPTWTAMATWTPSSDMTLATPGTSRTPARRRARPSSLSTGNPFGLTYVAGMPAPPSPTWMATATWTPSSVYGDGTTQFFRNTGTASAPAFAGSSANPFGFGDVGWHAHPAFADLDGDGDLDAFIGENYGNTVYFQNTGTATAPAFAAPSTNPFGLADVGYYGQPDLCGPG